MYMFRVKATIVIYTMNCVPEEEIISLNEGVIKHNKWLLDIEIKILSQCLC